MLPPPFGPTPTPAQLTWQRMETNLFVHFGMNTFTDREWGDGSESPAWFNPEQLDCGQWARAAKAGGFRTVILTAKHHDGFCLWPTATTRHSVAASPWRAGRGDLVREFVDAMRAEGLGVGLYLSPWDRNAGCYGDSPAYNDFYCAQLTELLTRYGPLVEVWFDGACAEGPNGRKQVYDWDRFFALVKQLQPGAVTFGDGGTDVRWVGNERGLAGDPCWATIDPRRVRNPGDSGIATGVDAIAQGELRALLETGEPPGPGARRVWRPAECDVSIRPGWFYHAAEDGEVRSVDDLVELYLHSVGRNSLLLLNVPPMPNGLMHPTDVARLAAFRTARERLQSRDLAHSAVIGPDPAAACLADGDPATFWMPADQAHSGEVTLSWRERNRQNVAMIDLSEPVAHGQRIHRFMIEGQATAGGPWQMLAEGTTVGLRRLVRVAPGQWQALRVSMDALAPLALSRVGVYPEAET